MPNEPSFTGDRRVSQADSPTLAEGFQDKLLGLFAEATALVQQLHKTAATAQRLQDCPAAASSLLRILDEQGPQAVPGLARARGLSRQNIQIMVNRLRAQGLVTLTPNPAHKRSALVHLTARAHALLASTSQQERQTSAALLPYIPEARLVPAATLLCRIRQLLGGVALPTAPPRRELPATPKTKVPPKRPGRKEAAPAALEAPPPEPGEPEESEFPVNLL